MKIIKKAYIQVWSYRHTCHKCDTEMEIEKSDVHTQYYSGYGREEDYDQFYCFCPVCRGKIVLVSARIPKAVQFEIKQRSSYFDTSR
jgi:hypothetical protein